MRAIKLLKRFAAVILAVAGLMMFSGCGADGANGGNIVEAQIDGSGALTAINRASKPIHKPVGVAVKLPSAFALFKWFPTILREPLSASDTLSEATAPVKLPA